MFAYPFEDVRTKAQNYWRDVGTVDAYYEANMELVRVSPELNIYDEQWPIWTYQEQLPPAKFVFDDDGPPRLRDRLDGVGRLHHLGLARVATRCCSRNVRVHDYSTIDRSVVLPRVHIGEHCVIQQRDHRRRRVVPDGMQIGVDPAADAERFYVTEDGVVLVTAAMLRALDRPASAEPGTEPCSPPLDRHSRRSQRCPGLPAACDVRRAPRHAGVLRVARHRNSWRRR